jgi:hypothetical protein
VLNTALDEPGIVLLPDPPAGTDGDAAARHDAVDPALVILTCASCGSAMDERKCKLVCRCGYFLSCSDYL